MAQPEQKFRAGPISVQIWPNEAQSKDGKKNIYRTVSIQRSYKDKDGQWKNTQSFREMDLPKIQLLLTEAYKYILTTPTQSDESEAESNTVVEEMVE